MKDQPDLESAARFLASNARVLEWRCFERLCAGGAAQPIRDAVLAYRNPDGGFGHALEPDGRCPATQPLAIEFALRVLDQFDAWDEEVAKGACDWLEAHQPLEGGAAFTEPTIAAWPHAPWWVFQEGRPMSLAATGQIASSLLARAVKHDWLERATELLWSQIDRLADPNPYDMYGLLRFLQHVPDRQRAQAAFQGVGEILLNSELVALDPEAPGEVHGPLNYAPEPDSLARRVFDRDTIEAHLTHLARSQAEDGGWHFNWPAWSPVAARAWRGYVTVESLRVLRANRRL